MAKVIQWKHGTTKQHEAYTGQGREITIDDDLHTIRVHDSVVVTTRATPDVDVGPVSPGDETDVVGVSLSEPLALLDDVPTKLSDLTDDVGVWRIDELVNLSQLSNDAGFWKKTDLTKISQLQNDSGFLTGHCSYCTHCTYCNQCSNCHNCTTVNCTTVQCNTKQCSECKYCSNCDCDCGDDTCFISGRFKTKRGEIDVCDIRVGDELLDFLGSYVKVVGVSHGHLNARRAIEMRGHGRNVITDDHPIVLFKNGKRTYEYSACINSSFNPNKIIKADNGVLGRYSESNDYSGRFLPTIELPPDTPTVCPITERETIIKFGNGYVLVPGRLP